MQLDYLYEIVKKDAEKKLQNILSLCDSPIEKKFVGHLYCFFLKKGIYPYLKTIQPTYFEFGKNGGINTKYTLVNDEGITVQILNKKVEIANSYFGEIELLVGFRVNCGYIIYDIYPQFPVFDENKIKVLDFCIQMIDPNTQKAIANFAIECDGFEWHHTLQQLNADNIRNRFLTKHDFKIIRYTGSEINRIDDDIILELENTMYFSYFKKESQLYELSKY